MAHTPGPWRLHPDSGVIIVNGSTVYSVKDLTTENEVGMAGDASLDDKRLMAAAPELLAACKLAMSVGGTQQFYVNSIIADAIAKAEGVANAEK